ncbi:MAG: ComF family protein [Rubrivivax sp.]|nr:ComF family protein [Rubrivivax sp.]MDP3615979.1 ComF family protein [Rubrivivax sp.]
MPSPHFLPLPSQCEVCRQWDRAALCSHCITRFAQAVPRCGRCGLRMGLAAQACGSCQREPPPFESCCSVADYSFPWDRLIVAFKFEGRLELATALASALHGAVQSQGRPAPGLVLPVPLSPQRLAERGYNQAWELARRVARATGTPARADVLLRPGETAHQAELSRAQRQTNLRRAFMVDPRLRPALAGRSVALVDDVMTTGATVREAATVLLRAGAAAVHVWVVARTPDH